jgi:hypothetical protein
MVSFSLHSFALSSPRVVSARGSWSYVEGKREEAMIVECIQVTLQLNTWQKSMAHCKLT